MESPTHPSIQNKLPSWHENLQTASSCRSAFGRHQMPFLVPLSLPWWWVVWPTFSHQMRWCWKKSPLVLWENQILETYPYALENSHFEPKHGGGWKMIFLFQLGDFLGSSRYFSRGVSGTIYFFSSCGIGRYNSTAAIASTCNQSTHGVWHSESVSENLFDTKKKGETRKSWMDFCAFLSQIANFVPIGGENLGKFPKVFHTSQGTCQDNSHHFSIPGDWSKTLRETFFWFDAPFFFGWVEGWSDLPRFQVCNRCWTSWQWVPWAEWINESNLSSVLSLWLEGTTWKNPGIVI